MAIADLAGRYSGDNKLWFMPGDAAKESEAVAVIDGDTLSYTWSFDGKERHGVLTIGDDTATWRDSFHQPAEVTLAAVRDFGARYAGAYAYPAGDGSPDWHWRIVVTKRPEGPVVVQMTNLPPWGEEGLAVQMTLNAAS